jgi:hypothetical protein
MELVYFLTANGWKKGPVEDDEKLETWVVTSQMHGAARLTKWTCAANSKHLDIEQRRRLLQRFGLPPFVTDSDGEVAIES